jgi:DNA-binding NarL/FixJ family response regulator
MKRIRVVIADDSPHSLAALQALLATWAPCEVVGEAITGQAVLALIEERRPDLVLLDVIMPVPDGIAATRLIKAWWPGIKVVLLSIDERYRRAADAAGADAFVGKSVAAERLLPMLDVLCTPG